MRRVGGSLSLIALIVLFSAGAVGSQPGTTAPPTTTTATPMLSVVPSTGLVDGQIVDVHAEGFPPNTDLRLYTCPRDDRFRSQCKRWYGIITADSAGVVDLTYQLQLRLWFGYAGPNPCGDGPCDLVLSDDLGLSEPLIAAAPLGIDRAAPLLGDLALSVDPSEFLDDGQVVIVRGTNVYRCDAWGGACSETITVYQRPGGVSPGPPCVEIDRPRIESGGWFEIRAAVQEHMAYPCPDSTCSITIEQGAHGAYALISFGSAPTTTTKAVPTTAPEPAAPVGSTPTYTG